MQVGEKLILGTVQLGLPYGINNQNGQPDRQTSIALLDTAYKAGVRMLDTAEAYGDAHDVIGAYHNSFSGSIFQVITKLSTKVQPEDIVRRIKENIRKLGVAQLYGYMFHTYQDYLRCEHHLKDLCNLEKEGIIRKIGVSLYMNSELEKVLLDPRIKLIQLPFNLLDNAHQRGELLKKAFSQGKEVHVRSVFLQGLFFKSPECLPHGLVKLTPYVERLKSIALEEGVDIGHLALAYALNQSHVSKVLIGVDSKAQLLENIEAARTQLSHNSIREIDKIAVRETELLNPYNW